MDNVVFCCLYFSSISYQLGILDVMLDQGTQLAVQCEGSAWALMRAQPSVIRRPVVDWGDAITVGFDATAWSRRSEAGTKPAALQPYQSAFASIFTTG